MNKLSELVARWREEDKRRIAVLEFALEQACTDLTPHVHFRDTRLGGERDISVALIRWYITQAEVELKEAKP
jgi:hypothetical protein